MRFPEIEEISEETVLDASPFCSVTFIHGWTDEWMNEWMTDWMNELINDGWMIAKFYLYAFPLCRIVNSFIKWYMNEWVNK